MGRIADFFRKRHISGRKTILISWLVSYIAVLIIPIIGNFVIDFYIRDAFVEEIAHSNNLRLEVLRNEVDKFFYEGERLADMLLYNETAAELAGTGIPDGSLRYRARELGTELKHNMVMSMQNITGYVYLPQKDLILTHGMLLESKPFFDAYYSASGMSYEDWLDSLLSEFPHVQSVRSAYDITGGEVIENIRPINMSEKDPDKRVVLLTAIDSRTLFECISDFGNGGAVVILGSDRRIMLEQGEDYEADFFKDIQFDPKNPAVSFRHGSEERIASSVKSGRNGMEYVYIVSAEDFNRKLNTIWRIVALMLILSLAVGAVVIFVNMTKNYKPVKGLMKLLEKIEQTDEQGSDEYTIIKSVIQKLVSSNIKTASVLRMNNEAMREAYLLKTVTGGIVTDEMKGRIKEATVRFDKKYFYVVLFRIENLGSFAEDPEHEKDSMSMAQYAVCNIVNELLGQHFDCYTCKTEDTIICVINVEGDGQRNKLKRDIIEAQDNIGYYLGIMLTAVLSGVGSSPEELNKLYYDALYAEEYSNTMGGDIIDCTEIDREMNRSLDYSHIKWKEMLSFIKKGDMEAARSVLEDIIETDFENGMASRQIQRGFACTLISMIINLSNEMGVMSEELLYRSADYFRDLTENFEVNRLRSAVLELGGIICASITRDKKENIALSDNIKAYVEQHFNDPNLNVTMVGQQFEMTASYASKIFLEQTGIKLLDYISAYRVGKAKELLDNTDDKIEDIGAEVGFSVHRTFLRTFKKHEGISPGAYRERFN